MSVIERFEHDLATDGLTEALWNRMHALVQQTEQFAEITGNAHFLVRSCTRIGGRIQEAAPGLSVMLARTALTWDRHNGHAWSVRARSLELLDRPDLAEAALWEGLRNAPHNGAIYVQLAMMLADQDRLAEAESLLTTAAAIDAEHSAAFSELARVLWRNGKAAEAVTLLEGASARLRGAVCLYQLGSILLAENRLPEAERAVIRYRREFGRNTLIDGLAERIRRGAIDEEQAHLLERRSRVAARSPVPWDERNLDVEAAEAKALARVRALTEADRRFRQGDDDSSRRALATVDEALNADAANGYALVVKALGHSPSRTVLAARLEARFPNDLPLHLAVTGTDTPPAQWRDLLNRFPQDETLVRLTRLGHGGGDDDGKLAEWSEPTPPPDDTWTPFVQGNLRRYFAGETLPTAISPPMLARDGILRQVDVTWGLPVGRTH